MGVRGSEYQRGVRAHGHELERAAFVARHHDVVGAVHADIEQGHEREVQGQPAIDDGRGPRFDTVETRDPDMREYRRLDDFADGPWGQKYPAIAQSWRRNWPEVIPFFAFPDDVRRMIYTTNAIESLNAKLRRAVRTRGHFPTDESALKLLFLVLNLAAKEWKMPPREWCRAKAQLAILFEDRFTLA